MNAQRGMAYPMVQPGYGAMPMGGMQMGMMPTAGPASGNPVMSLNASKMSGFSFLDSSSSKPPEDNSFNFVKDVMKTEPRR